MKKNIIVLLLLLLLSSLSQAENEPLDEKWLEKDKSNFINLMKVIESNSSDIEYYKKQIKSLEITKEKLIGFGMKKFRAYQTGGYISSRIIIYTYEGNIFYFRVTIENKEALEKMDILKERDPKIVKLLAKNWQEEFSQPYLPEIDETFRTLEYERFDKKIYLKFKQSVAHSLGEPFNIPIDDSLKDEYETLVFPFEGYDFGTYCYMGGSQPSGREAIEVIKKENPKLLRNVIRGYSPEGRIYGVEALLQLAKKGTITLTKKDKETIRKVLSLDIPIDQCGGCMVSSLKAKELFQQKEYKELLQKNNIFISQKTQ